MTTTVQTRKHFTIAIDWKGRCIEQWLEQYGSSLLLDNKKTCLGYKSILGDMADRENGYQVDGRRRVLPRCNINIYEEMAIEDLLEHISKTESPKVLQWLKTVILYYIDGKPEEDIANILGMTMYAVKRDKMLGVLRIASRFKIPSFLTD